MKKKLPGDVLARLVNKIGTIPEVAKATGENDKNVHKKIKIARWVKCYIPESEKEKYC